MRFDGFDEKRPLFLQKQNFGVSLQLYYEGEQNPLRNQ